MPGSFDHFKLNPQILRAIDKLGFDEPTEIQEKCIPQAMSGHDILGVAPTGTGKTAAFVLPILMKLKYAQGNDPRCIILVPSRELALQIEEAILELSVNSDLRIVAIFGGTGKTLQRVKLGPGVDVLIATPGRLMEFYQDRLFDTRSVKVMVLDEADKMMDMGFMPQIRRILEIIPVKRQNLLFSATMPEKVMKLSEEFLEFPHYIEVQHQTKVADTIQHYFHEVPNLKTKINLVEHFISTFDFDKIIVFVKTKQIANDVFRFIQRKTELMAKVIHGNKEQNTRLNAIDSFRSGETRILVATDVVARGIDVSDVSLVINFDVPLVYEDYIHRVGRTGRAKNLGEAVTLVNPAEFYHLKKIEKIVGEPIEKRSFASELLQEETSKEEKQRMAREIDYQKRKENPEYKGAFHEKKKKSKVPSTKSQRNKKR